MKRIAWSLIICLSFFSSSCSMGLVAVHGQYPYFCFVKGCRQIEKQEKRSNQNIKSYSRSGAKGKKRILKRGKSKLNHGRNSKQKIGGTPRFN